MSRRIVITGAAQGLGAAIARAFAARGAELVLIDRDSESLSHIATVTGGLPLTCDLSDAVQTDEAIACFSQGRPIDALIHNAAILRAEPMEDLSFAMFTSTVNVGLQAAFQLTKAVWPAMKQRGGALIFVSSQSGIKGFAGETAYCAAKHGLEGFSKSLALEGEAHGIVSCTITPGKAMRTPMSERNYTPEAKAHWVEPDLLAPAFVHIAESLDPLLNGQRLNAWDISEHIRSAK
jgi:NAD(P)-dependent dehydrogenase (short-subunit alcohol dehydrogenase family)